MSEWPNKITIKRRSFNTRLIVTPVLVVATEDVVRNVVIESFESRGVECIVTNSIHEAFDILVENPSIKNVVLDYVETNMDIAWFLAELKSGDVKVNVFGASDSNDPEDFHRYGRIYHLPKFWSFGKLISSIEQANLLSV